MLDNINAIRDIVRTESFVTGWWGDKLKDYAGTDAHDVLNAVNMIKANIGLDQLNRMRQNLPAGGVLGDIGEVERDMLQTALGSLEQSPSEEQFLRTLQDVENVYQEIIHGPDWRKVVGQPPSSGEQQLSPELQALVEKYSN